MMIYPELLLTLAHDRQNELIAEAARAHLLRSARRSARARNVSRPAAHAARQTVPAPASPLAKATVTTAARSRADGNVAACGPRAAAPAGR